MIREQREMYTFQRKPQATERFLDLSNAETALCAQSK